MSELDASSASFATRPLVVLEPITRDQAPALQNLFELYAYDFSEFLPLELKANGRFDVTPGDQWWSVEHHFPFFVRCEGALVGFALARKGSRITGEPDVMDMAEFFVVRGARRKKIGTSLAHELFRAFPGPWEIRVRRIHPSAMAFWFRVASDWVGSPVPSIPLSIDGVFWDVLQIGQPAK